MYWFRCSWCFKIFGSNGNRYMFSLYPYFLRKWGWRGGGGTLLRGSPCLIFLPWGLALIRGRALIRAQTLMRGQTTSYESLFSVCSVDDGFYRIWSSSRFKSLPRGHHPGYWLYHNEETGKFSFRTEEYDLTWTPLNPLKRYKVFGI